MQIFGQYDEDYKSFPDAFKSVLYLILGQGDSYLVVSVFISIYTYSYGLTILSEGYPDSKSDDKEKAKKFNYKAVVRWLVGWMPFSLLKRVSDRSPVVEPPRRLPRPGVL